MQARAANGEGSGVDSTCSDFNVSLFRSSSALSPLLTTSLPFCSSLRPCAAPAWSRLLPAAFSLLWLAVPGMRLAKKCSIWMYELKCPQVLPVFALLGNCPFLGKGPATTFLMRLRPELVSPIQSTLKF